MARIAKLLTEMTAGTLLIKCPTKLLTKNFYCFLKSLEIFEIHKRKSAFGEWP